MEQTYSNYHQGNGCQGDEGQAAPTEGQVLGHGDIPPTKGQVWGTYVTEQAHKMQWRLRTQCIMAKIVNTLRWRKGKEDESPKAPNAHKVPDVRARDVCCLSMFPKSFVHDAPHLLLM